MIAWEKSVRNDKDNIKLQKRAFKYSLTAKCTDDPIFLEISLNVFNLESTAGLSKI